MPSRYSSDHSVADAQALAERLGIDWKIVPIDPIHKGYESLPVIGEDLSGEAASLADLRGWRYLVTVTMPTVANGPEERGKDGAGGRRTSRAGTYGRTG